MYFWTESLFFRSGMSLNSVASTIPFPHEAAGGFAIQIPFDFFIFHFSSFRSSGRLYVSAKKAKYFFPNFFCSLLKLFHIWSFLLRAEVVGNLFIFIPGGSWSKSTGWDFSQTTSMSQAGPGWLPKSADDHWNREEGWIRERSSIASSTLSCWRYTWIEGELLDDLDDTLRINKICFFIIIRNVFWGVAAVFK